MQLLMTAMSVSEKIRTKGIEIGERTSHLPLSFRLGEDQWVVIFRFGVVVTVGLSDKERNDILSELEPFIDEPDTSIETESLFIQTGSNEDKFEGDYVRVTELTRQHVLTMADILAKSVMLGRYEAAMSEVFQQIEPLALRLRSGVGKTRTYRELVSTIGSALLIQHTMVGGVEVNEKPEILWEHPELERLYLKLEDEFEIIERSKALERKLKLVTDTTEKQLGLQHNAHSLRVEWYIVILIIVEIMLTLYEMFIKHV
ncbi:RMD1 family protein [Geovibrio thiophilus]|uniref:RMD1 family protein n=1 Tax=Geovibrio thiophilus TaxID=139438 RepID=A0A410JWV7_9BACT|nr:RMD1 family protein [Geovibrio thiophilus]QAR32511.1 RMD1 family protein [Geovibrio thiophilus]